VIVLALLVAAAVAVPAAVLLTRGRRSAFARTHAAEALAFDGSVLAYLGATQAVLHVTAGSPYTVQLVPFALFVTLFLAFNWAVFSVIGVHRAATGQSFTYPLTPRVVRDRLPH
jgi:uncharacterized Tic20 family protein